MPRSPRAAVGGIVYHVLNRGNARRGLFASSDDYELFLSILAAAHGRTRMRTLGYCIMPNHWHLLLRPLGDGDLSEFMRWLTVTHTQRWHAGHGTAGTGHLYQGRFKSFPVQSRRATAEQRRAGWLSAGDPVLSVLRYVERNPLRAGLVTRAEAWPWSSLCCRGPAAAEGRPPLPLPPGRLPPNWAQYVNGPQSEDELAAIHHSLQRGAPLGRAGWVRRIAEHLGLQSTLRPRGRPRKPSQKGS